MALIETTLIIVYDADDKKICISQSMTMVISHNICIIGGRFNWCCFRQPEHKEVIVRELLCFFASPLRCENKAAGTAIRLLSKYFILAVRIVAHRWHLRVILYSAGYDSIDHLCARVLQRVIGSLWFPVCTSADDTTQGESLKCGPERVGLSMKNRSTCVTCNCSSLSTNHFIYSMPFSLLTGGLFHDHAAFTDWI